MLQRGSNLHKWDKDEIALQHAWVRNLQIGSGDGFVAVEKNIEIDEARTFGEELFAAHSGFDAAHGGKQIVGGEIGLDLEDSVKEPGLVEIIDRLGFVEAGNSRDMNVAFAEETNRFAKVLLAIADV